MKKNNIKLCHRPIVNIMSDMDRCEMMFHKSDKTGYFSNRQKKREMASMVSERLDFFFIKAFFYVPKRYF
jgi:hypothetical protein